MNGICKFGYLSRKNLVVINKMVGCLLNIFAQAKIYFPTDLELVSCFIALTYCSYGKIEEQFRSLTFTRLELSL